MSVILHIIRVSEPDVTCNNALCTGMSTAHLCNTLQILSASHSLHYSAIVLKHKGRIKTAFEGTIFQLSEWRLPIAPCKCCWSYCNALAALQHWPTFFFFFSPITVINFRLEKKKRWPSTELNWDEKKISKFHSWQSSFQVFRRLAAVSV